MRVELQPGFILHSRPYRDTSLLIEAITADYGRIGLIARGVRTSKSKLKSVLQIFTPLLLSWSGKNDLCNLRTAEIDGVMLQISGVRWFSACYINELMLRLLVRFDAQPVLFERYRQVLTDLSTARPMEPLLRVFEKQLLDEIGYGLSLSHDISGLPIETGRWYHYSLTRGPVLLDRDTQLSGMGVKVSGDSLLALANERFEDKTMLAELKLLMRAAIDQQLDGKPLRTRQMFIDYQRLRTQ